MKLCDWDKRTRFAADVNAHVSGKKSIVYPFVLLGYSDDPTLQLQCARNYIENMFSSLAATILVRSRRGAMTSCGSPISPPIFVHIR